jgi:hypothetical protein
MARVPAAKRNFAARALSQVWPVVRDATGVYRAGTFRTNFDALRGFTQTLRVTLKPVGENNANAQSAQAGRAGVLPAGSRGAVVRSG